MQVDQIALSLVVMYALEVVMGGYSELVSNRSKGTVQRVHYSSPMSCSQEGATIELAQGDQTMVHKGPTMDSTRSR
jgi:hypothetical protein